MPSQTSSGSTYSPGGTLRAPVPRSIPELIEPAAGRDPEAPAVVSDSGHAGASSVLTYHELRYRAAALARRLRAHGVGPETMVALAGERSPELVVGLLGVLEAGGAYLPLDPDDPPGRLRFLLDDVRPAVLLLDPRCADRIPPPPDGTLVLSLDGRSSRRGVCGEDGNGTSALDGIRTGGISGWSGKRTGATSGLAPEGMEEALGSALPSRHGGPSRTGRELAYVLHTSGSSGRPKGVLVEHRSVVSRLVHGQEAIPLGHDDAVLLKTPLGFDVSVPEIFWTLMTGARLVLARPGGHRDPGYLADLIERERVTVLHFVPSMLRSFLDVDEVGEKCRSVRHVLAGGEALPFDLTRRFYDLMPPTAELHNLYGPTEATVAVTHWPVPRHPRDEVVPIGRPLGDARLHVLDRQGRKADEDVVGELHIGGVQVARGYLNRPDLTAERFVPDPFTDEEDARMYRTGDRARWRADGTLEFLGRIDRQVQVRGVRVEPGEVEAALLRVPGVQEAAVVLREDDPGVPRLVAYVVTDSDAAVGVPELRSSLTAELPEPMVPSAFVVLEDFPRGPTEKVDLGRLPPPGRDRPRLSIPFAPPTNELERFLAELWSRVLDVEPVGIHDRFFELGGTSLHAARIVAAVSERVGEPVYVVTLFEAPTVRGYAKLLRREYGLGGAHRARESVAPSRAKVLDRETVASFEALVPHHVDPARPVEAERRNPPAIFILAPPRSGTTLLRVMLAGHSGIFAAPELNLLNFETLAQRREAFSGKQRHWLEGTVRTLMELHSLGPDDAWAAMTEHEEAGLDTQAFYRLLQDRISPRLLADKTPAYALEPAAMDRAEKGFVDPLYIHLVRHPWATVRSFREQRLEQLLFLREHDFTAMELAELVWLVSHRNVMEFLATVPEERWVRIRFEELVTHPEATLQTLCARLGLSYEPSMADPYRSLDQKMVDGVHPESVPMGDRKLLGKTGVDPEAARERLRGLTRSGLSPLTWDVAAALGYEPPAENVPTAGSRDSPMRDRGRFRRDRLAAFPGRGPRGAGFG